MTPSSSSARDLGAVHPGHLTAAGAAPRLSPASFRERLTLRRRAPLLRRLREELQPGPGVRVLDLGGGTGATTERFAEGADEVVVLEPDPKKVARGRAIRATLGFVEGVAEQLPFEDGRFDRVVSLLSFHHFQDSSRALSEGYRVLAPGGSLTVCDLDPTSWMGRLIRVLHAPTFHARLSFARPDEVSRRASAAGFSSVRRERLGPAYLVTATK
jgi:ubiquinone/menaquinone biosynthesis C-methylase UbiE